MSYLDTKISREQFIKQSGKKMTQESAKMSLKLFEWFCKDEYDGKTGDEIISEVQVVIKQHGNQNMVYIICSAFILWLQEEHPEIKTQREGQVP